MNDMNYQVFLKRETLRYTDAGAAKELFHLPAKAIVLRFMVDVKTAFDGSGTDLLDLGKTGDADFFANDVDLSSADQTLVEQFELGDVGANPITVTGTYADQNSDATAGEAEIVCLYAHWALT